MTAVAIVLVLLYVRHGSFAVQDTLTRRDPVAEPLLALIAEEEVA